MSLGPRVGGAHVDVSAKYDAKSLNDVGKQIHRQLASIGAHNKRVYQRMGSEAVTAWRTVLGVAVTSAPLIGSAISGLAGAATMLAGALNESVVAMGGLVGVAGSLGMAMWTMSFGFNHVVEAMNEIDPKKLKQLLAEMTPAAREFTLALRDLKKDLQDQIQNRIFAGLLDEMQALRQDFIPVLTKGFLSMADALNSLFKELSRYLGSANGLKTVNTALQGSASIFEHLSKAVVPFLDGFLKWHNALIPASTRLADRITDVGKRFQDWASAPGFAKRIDDRMKQAEKTSGLLFRVLGNLYKAIQNIFSAANPATNTFLQMLVNITEKFEKWTASVGGQQSIATWAAQSVEVMRQFGKTIGAIFKVIAELADPRVIISFLNTVEGAFNILGQLPLDKIVSAFADWAEALQPVSSWFLAIIIAGAGLNVLIGSIMGQLGGLVALFGRLTGIDPFKSIGGKGGGKHVKEVGKISKAFGALGSVLGKGLKFAGWAGLAIWIADVVSKSDKLKAKGVKAFEAFKDILIPLEGAFNGVKASLGPLLTALEPVFKFMDKMLGLAIGVFLDMLIYGFESVGNVIEGAGKIIAGLMDVITGLIKWDWSAVWDGIKKIGSGLKPLLEGVFGLFITFFAPAKLLKVGATALRGLLGGLKTGAGAIFGFIPRLIGGIFKFFLSLPGRLLSLGGRAVVGLGRAFVKYAPKVLAAAGRIVVSVLKWIGRLVPRLLKLGGQAIMNLGKAIVKYTPKVLVFVGKLQIGIIKWIARLVPRLLSLGGQAIMKLGGAIAKYTPKVLSFAGKIFTGVVRWIAKLPGRLLTLGGQAITKLGGAIRAGISKVRDLAGRIFTAIVDKVKNLPGEMLKIGKNIMRDLASGILSGLRKVKDAAGKIGSAIKNVLPGSPVKEGPLTAWNRGSGATGGGRNVIDAIIGGLNDTDPIKKAMAGVAGAVSASLTPQIGRPSAAGIDYQRLANTLEASRPPRQLYGDVTVIDGYGGFKRQMMEDRRRAEMGGRR